MMCILFCHSINTNRLSLHFRSSRIFKSTLKMPGSKSPRKISLITRTARKSSSGSSAPTDSQYYWSTADVWGTVSTVDPTDSSRSQQSISDGQSTLQLDSFLRRMSPEVPAASYPYTCPKCAASSQLDASAAAPAETVVSQDDQTTGTTTLVDSTQKLVISNSEADDWPASRDRQHRISRVES